jgi:hypothetical protein
VASQDLVVGFHLSGRTRSYHKFADPLYVLEMNGTSSYPTVATLITVMIEIQITPKTKTVNVNVPLNLLGRAGYSSRYSLIIEILLRNHSKRGNQFKRAILMWCPQTGNAKGNVREDGGIGLLL